MPETTNQILIVDDEIAIQSLIKRYFEKRGATVHCVGSGEDMQPVLDQFPIDIVFLDVHLPGKDGFTLLNELKRDHDVGVIMLTSRCELNDRIAGLDAGADDYVPKPFEVSELMARSNAVLRRLGRFKNTSEPETCRYCFAGYCMDCKVRKLYRTHNLEIHLDNQHLVELSPAEFDLLRVFVQHPETVLSRDYLLQQTRGRTAAPFDRTIDVRVGQLRKKLTVPESDQPLFKTIRGGGYMMRAAVDKMTTES